jgi:hypothetical protein
LYDTCRTIGEGYTSLHQDGHGTVDSGHTILKGHNKVFILPRIAEKHENQVCDVLLGGKGDPKSKDGIKALYRLPHDEEGTIKTFKWPTMQMIQKLKDLG